VEGAPGALAWALGEAASFHQRHLSSWGVEEDEMLRDRLHLFEMEQEAVWALSPPLSAFVASLRALLSPQDQLYLGQSSSLEHVPYVG
jgi:hypothetical protein